MNQTGASRIVEALQEGNVRCVFGLPGTQTVELFEALRLSGLRTVAATNELSATFMAGGWARMTCEPGVVLTIAGPGFAWALPGLAEARLDSVPLLHITGGPGGGIGRRFRQQELDQAAIAASLVKDVIEADSHSDPGVAVLDGLLLARSGEPGPVLFQVSQTTLGRELDAGILDPPSTSSVNHDALEEACSRVRLARRPVLLVGQGVNGHTHDLRAVVDQLKAPVLTTPSARGVIPEDHPCNLAFDPLAGSIGEINALVESCDLVLAIGCKLGHGGTSGFELKLPEDRLIHIDASAGVIGANYPVSLGVVADAGDLLRALLSSSLSASAWTANELETWRIRASVRPPRMPEPRVAGTSDGDARSFFQALRRALPADAVLVLDSGLHQVLARRYFSVLAPGGLILPMDLQSMGFAIPTAIGAQLAVPDRPVVALLGDGGFAMTAMELLTAIKERTPLVAIVFVDGAFGQIRMEQLANYGASHAVTLQNPDLSLLTEALGARYELVGDIDIETAVRAALSNSGVTVIEVPVGDTLATHRVVAFARGREATRRVAGPRVFRSIANAFRRLGRAIGYAVVAGTPTASKITVATEGMPWP